MIIKSMDYVQDENASCQSNHSRWEYTCPKLLGWSFQARARIFPAGIADSSHEQSLACKPCGCYPFEMPNSLIANPPLIPLALQLLAGFAGGESDSESLNCTVLSGGHSGATNVRFEHQGASYVLRCFAPNQRTVTRTHGALVAKIAGERGLGPKVHYVAPRVEGFVMDFLSGRTATNGHFQERDNLRHFARFLHTVHQTDGEFPRAYSPFTVFLRRLTAGADLGAQYPSCMVEAKDRLSDVEATLSLRSVPQTLTHNDLNSLNIIIDDDRFWLIDWECAGWGDPYLDLAMFTTFQGLSIHQTQEFLEAYFGRAPTRMEQDRFLIAQPIPYLLRGAVFLGEPVTDTTTKEYDRQLARGDIPSADQVLLEHSEGRLNRTRQQIGLSLLQRGLELADRTEFKTAIQRLQNGTALLEGVSDLKDL